MAETRDGQVTPMDDRMASRGRETLSATDMARLGAVAAAAAALVAIVLAVVIAGCGGAAVADGLAATVTTSPSPVSAAPLKVLASSPRRAATGVSFAKTLTIRFSAALAVDTPHPRLLPEVPGIWKAVTPTTLVFRPTGHWPLLTTIRLIVAAGRKGLRSSAGGLLDKPYVSSFTVGGASVLRLQQLLAGLRYLPLRFRAKRSSRTDGVGMGVDTSTPSPEAATPGAESTSSPTSGATPTVAPSEESSAAESPAAAPPATATVSTHAAQRTSPDLVTLTVQRGIFTWRYPQLRGMLGSLWQRGDYTVLVRGAVMAFQADHGMIADGVVGRQFWAALLRAVARHQVDRHSYDYLEVSTASPEMLYVWRNGRIVYRSLANTGIAERPTAYGTFAVYARYLSTTMSGTNPDGSHYSDPGVPYVAYFNGGDAVHGFLRGSYGWPQSLGCVELPYSAAAVVFQYDPIGTLVAVH